MLELENGARAVQYAWTQPEPRHGTRAHGIVLAHDEHDYNPWITWMFVAREDGTVFCESGHYFPEYEAAHEDYLERVRRGH
jgi:hypothetical protein